ncbi:HTH-type transcriptional regulator BhcR [Amaricoccus sp.]|uniref:HTH-type transcriptional regulator BhcR n=1 Tax=Amaricoccus sp. TaxID=1872485 RepID=UPI0025C594B3|nr:HTH-type transcriptional regulator BhcR [Amaricoccus sp.]
MKRARGRPRGFNVDPEAGTVQSLDRALAILKVLASGEGMSLTELAAAAGQAPATVYRALQTFASHGMATQEPESQLWAVGPEAFRIGAAFLTRTSLVEMARPELRALMAETDETANLAIADGAEVVFLSQVETQQPIRAFFRLGARGPIHASGIGKALLAFGPEARLERLLRSGPLATYTARTLADPPALRADLALTRARGWAIDDEERTEGMRCIAAPIFNEHREAVAGVSVSGPTLRVSSDRAEALGAVVRAAADRITAAMGGDAPRG